MNITYLIGNGFDINLGLRTRFLDFIDSYLKNVEADDKNIERFKTYISKCLEERRTGNDNAIDWSNAEKAFGEYTKEFEGIENADRLFSEQHYDFCNKLAYYLEEEESILNNLDDNWLKNSGDQLWKSLINYSDEVKPNEKRSINEYVKNIGGGYSIHIINFNYTNTIDRIIDFIKNNLSIGKRAFQRTEYSNAIYTPIHVHGTYSHGMAMGLNDESQIKLDIFTNQDPEYKRQFIKPYVNTDMGENNDDEAKEIISKSDIIYIYGMSIGETDTRWWESIKDRLINSSTTILIIHGYSVPEPGLITTPNMMAIRQIKTKFRSTCGEISEQSWNAIQSRIFVTGTNKFSYLSNIIRCKEDNMSDENDQ